MAQPTEGPWEVLSDHNGIWVAGGRSPDPVTKARYLFVAKVYDAPPPGGNPIWAWLTHDEALANAARMAAAPDLYDALRGMLATFECCASLAELPMIRQAEAALEKADGIQRP